MASYFHSRKKNFPKLPIITRFEHLRIINSSIKLNDHQIYADKLESDFESYDSHIKANNVLIDDISNSVNQINLHSLHILLISHISTYPFQLQQIKYIN